MKRVLLLGFSISIAAGLAAGAAVFFLAKDEPRQEEQAAAPAPEDKKGRVRKYDYSNLEQRRIAREEVTVNMKKEMEEELKRIKESSREEMIRKRRSAAIDRWLRK